MGARENGEGEDLQAVEAEADIGFYHSSLVKLPKP
jgi:hypothetical protein